MSNQPPNFEEDDLLVVPQKTALTIVKRYVCASCFHKQGICTHLHMVQKPRDYDFDRWAVICTECGDNVLSREVGRITIWFLTHQGQKYIARYREIKLHQKRLDEARQKRDGTYHFDVDQAIKDLGF